MNDLSLTEIAAAMRATGFPPRFDAAESRLLIRLLQLVSEGSPVPKSMVEQADSNLQMPSGSTASLVEKLCERDGNGNIVGILGLSQRNHPHRFTINDRVLSTWCAWDALFIPALLQQAAKVESTCPATNEKVCIRISENRVEAIEPPESVITIAVPKVVGVKLESAERIRRAFCCFVHFFVSSESAAEWISANNYDLNVLSVEDGYQLGRMAFEYVLKLAEPISPTRDDK